MKSQSRVVFTDDFPGMTTELALALRPKDCVSLTGVIGAGKTTFMSYMLRTLGLPVDHPFSSPTFTVLNQYQTPQYLVNHIDLYRLRSFGELVDLDILQLFDDENSLTFIEWGDKFSELAKYYTKKIHFEYVQKNNLERLVQTMGF